MQCQAGVELAHHSVWGSGQAEQAESSWERVIELIRLQRFCVTTILIASCLHGYGKFWTLHVFDPNPAFSFEIN